MTQIRKKNNMTELRRFTVYFYLNKLSEYLGANRINITAYDEQGALREFRKAFPDVKFIRIEEWW